MTHHTTTGPGVLRDLGDGLILRRATRDDAEALAAFNAEVHRDPGEGPLEVLGVWTRDLLSGEHPTCGPDDFTVVEDTGGGRIVSTLCLISQTWSYGGVPFGVGRPELVGTHPEYRRRGLVRAQLEFVHGWSAARGELLQAITGIRWYYRQFGYELGGLDLGGGRTGYRPHVPKLGEGTPEPYRIRPAMGPDLPFIARVYERRAGRDRVVCERDEATWRYELDGRTPGSDAKWQLCVVESAEGQPVGYLAHPERLWNGEIGVREYELDGGVSWAAVTPSVIRYLGARGEEYAARSGTEFSAFSFWLGGEHPAYEAAADRLPADHPPYAWYLRVADVPGFLRHVAPALEARLAESLVAGHMGELKVSFYRDGLRLVFERGRLAEAEAWMPTPEDGGTAAFPGLTFLQLLFGYRSLRELRYAFADCWVRGDETRALLEALFPKQASHVWPLA